MKSLPKCFENYFQLASQVHIYSTRFAANENWSVPRFKKAYTQRSIKGGESSSQFRWFTIAKIELQFLIFLF